MQILYIHSLSQVSKPEGDEVAQQLKVSGWSVPKCTHLRYYALSTPGQIRRGKCKAQVECREGIPRLGESDPTCSETRQSGEKETQKDKMHNIITPL